MLDHAQLRALLHQRVRDGVLLRLIGKWLKAGVLEDGDLTYPTAGTPQGGVISPLLANVYLHYVLDEWFERTVKPCLRGRAFLVRYADDFVMGFACAEDARRVLAVLPKRFGKYGLQLHPDKTRLVPFGRPRGRLGRPGSDQASAAGSFDFLGFRHFWSRSRQGNWVVKQKTAGSRFGRALKAVGVWCRRHRHEPIGEQHRVLCQKLRGHYQYYGVVGNGRSLQRFRHAVEAVWRRWLARRRRGDPWFWERMDRLLARLPLPAPPLLGATARSEPVT